MIVLGIDTATRVSSVAIVDGDRVFEVNGDAKSRGTDLLVLIDRACVAAGIAAKQLDAVAIGAGPGSFTSLRIGMATAKGIAFALHKPLWAVSSLAALAAQMPGEHVAAVLDARRGEVYVGFAGDERVMPPDQLATLAATRFVGDAGVAYPQLLALPGVWDRTPRGADAAKLALAGARIDVVAHGVPAYLRPAEAEILYPDGVPGAMRKR